MNNTVIEEIKERADIVNIVSRYVTLKRIGQNYRGLCPFHPEKTPSFFVNPTLGIFKCFGCDKGGDVIKFVQEIEHISFKEALEKLAKEVGVTLPKSSYQDSKLYKERKQIIKINQTFAKAFQKVLFSSAGKHALHYLTNQRKLSIDTIKTFQIGYSPPDWNFMTNLANKLEISLKTLQKTGLITDKNKSRFFNRVMFPIFDIKGNIVGFSGRTLSNQKDIAKYLNTPETLVFHKRKILYGIYHNKIEITRSKLAIITEGQIDVLSAYQNGLKNVVAPLGTALTALHLLAVKKLTKHIAFAYDNDQAGQKALIRSVAIALSLDLIPYVIKIPKTYKDLDEALKNNVPIQDLLAQKEEFFKHQFKHLATLTKEDYSLFEEQLNITLELIALANPIRQKIILEKLISKLQLPKDAIYEKFKEIKENKDLLKQYTNIIKQGATTSTQVGSRKDIPTGQNRAKQSQHNTNEPEVLPVLLDTLLSLLFKFPDLYFGVPQKHALLQLLKDNHKEYHTLLNTINLFWKNNLKKLKNIEPLTLDALHTYYIEHLQQEFNRSLTAQGVKDNKLFQRIALLPHISMLTFSETLSKDIIILTSRIIKILVSRRLNQLSQELDTTLPNKQRNILDQIDKLHKLLAKLDDIKNKQIFNQPFT